MPDRIVRGSLFGRLDREPEPVDEMMRTKIIFLLDQLNLAGAQKRAANLAKGLDRDRFDVQIVCLFGGGPLQPEIEAAGIDLVLLDFSPNSRSLRNVSRLWNLSRRLRRERPRILHAFSYWSGVYGSIAGLLASVPVIITSRVSQYDLRPQGPIFRMIERVLNPLASAVTTISEAVSKDTIEIEGIPAHKIELVYNGVELSGGSETLDREAFRGSLGVSPEDAVVVMVANFFPYKRHETLLRAACGILADRPKTKFLMLGRESDEIENLKKMAADRGIASNIRWLGARKDVADILSIADIGVLCSESEALGNSILEYMDAGLPVVATETGGIPEMVLDGITGWLFAVGDADTLGRRLRELLDDPVRARQMGNAGRERVRENFSSDRMVRGYAAVYAKQLARKGQK